MRTLLLGLIFLILAIAGFSQSSIKGIVKDSSENRNLLNTVVSVLNKKDSILVKFTRADKNGNFKIENNKAGSYILLITHPYMGDYFDNIDIVANQDLELGNVYLTPKSKLLSEVIVRSGSPIKIKGDTLVYTADSFKVRPGANVEELLRRLPGITVDKSGQITAMGERVKKVLVDGEEFFGSDPGIATKNLRADAVQEVQVFDKKSDQAEFTGIDDGVRDKTINLKMKKMAGYFGKVELGGGLKDKYDNSVMANFFQNKRKIAGYGIMSNTGQTNLDWQDAQNFGGGPENMTSGMNDDGGMWITVSSGDDNYWGGRNGIPRNWNAGFHYSNKFNKEKNSFNSGYKFSKVISPGETRTYSQTFLPDTSLNSNTSSNSLSRNFTSTNKHAFNVTVDFNLDSNNSLKWTSKVNNNSSLSRIDYNSEMLDDQSLLINDITRRSIANSDKNNVTSNLLWRHKFKKLARTLSITTDFGWVSTKSDGLLFSENNFYQAGVLTRRDTIDQQNINETTNNTISSRIAYTEPLKKDFFLELSYGFSYANSKIDRLVYIQNINGKYEEPVDSLSNRFVFNNTQNTPGINFRLNKKKYSLSFGTSVAFNQFEKKNLSENTITHYNCTNTIPRASYTYKIKPNESLRINYNGSTTAPSPEQLQPTRVNTDRLNIYEGNPDLKQSFRHTISGDYNFYNVLKEKNMYANLSFNTTDNAFVQSSIINNSTGERRYKTVNADGVYSINLYTNYGFKISGTKWRTGFGPIFNLNRRIEYINGYKNINNTRSYGLSLNLNQYVPDKMNAYISTELSWNDSKSTVNSNANADYWQIEVYGNLNKTIKKWTIGTDLTFEARQKDPRFPQKNNYTRLNASLTKRFLKEDKLEIKLQVNDIFNENRGYDRNFSTYSYSETFYNTLRRFWLLTATWNISKNGKPSKMF
jgi:hypothetical protein